MPQSGRQHMTLGNPFVDYEDLFCYLYCSMRFELVNLFIIKNCNIDNGVRAADLN